jgi:hypothetical protein
MLQDLIYAIREGLTIFRNCRARRKRREQLRNTIPF